MLRPSRALICFLVLIVAILISSFIKPIDHLSRWFNSEKSVDIDVKSLQKMMKSNDVKLIDVREPDELVKDGKIPNSINIPLGEVEDAFKLDEKSFLEKYKIKKPNVADENLVFSCRSGFRSQQAQKIAQSLGYKNPLNLLGGYKAWAEENGA
ncbi:unnamed protein product [Schistosoma turkestanicum]|nr:unnamed protein product [Schistosoma turkestanicum]